MTQQPSPCKKCNAANPPKSIFCESCGWKMRATWKSESELVDMDEELLRGELSIVRQALAVIALFSLLGSTVQALSTENATTFDTVTTFLDPVLYAALWFWAKKRPYAAAVCGAVLFGVSQLSLILLQPAALAQGIVVKVIVISMLYRGIRAAARYRDFLRENGRG